MYKKFLLILVLQFSTVICNISTQCGVPSRSVGLIIKGNDFTRGKWPWMTALMLKENGTKKFICGGVLVSATKVVTAAHCIHQKYGERFKTRDILMILGAYDLSDRDELGVYSLPPSEIIIHPDWNPNIVRYDADIAALIFEDAVPLTTFIKPVCIATSDMNERKGFVTGWGKSKGHATKHESKPKELEIPIWSNEHCFLESNAFTLIASRRTFCAGNRDGRGVCSGDSGSGLFVESGGVFYLKGLVSASLFKEGLCDVSNFALFTNVNKFIEWIDVPTEQTSAALQKKQAACGIMSSSAGLVQNGKKSTNVQWPWIVVVFNKNYITRVGEDSYSRFEAGTLISEKHVIADAYQVTNEENGKRVPISTDLIKTYFGVINLDDYANTNSLVLDGADKIIVHPSLGNIDSLKFANFAIIKLKSIVAFSQYIAPICLSSFADDPYTLVGFGYSVGHGYSATGRTKDREYSPMRIRNKEVCDFEYEYSLGTAKNKSSLYFCAGGDGQSNACWSDHPFYMKLSGKWYLHAFMQVAYNDGSGCKLNKPVLYEIAGQYYDFIQNHIDED